MISTGTGKKSTNIRCVEVISNIPQQIEKIINYAMDYPEYYYIFHDKDKRDDGSLKTTHIHCLICDTNGTTLATWIGRLATIGVPGNMVQQVMFKSQAVRYLTHETAQAKAEGKYVYNRSDVKTNKPDKYASYFGGSNACTTERLDDFLKLKSHQISVQEYVEKYRSEIDELNFYQQVRVFGDLAKYGL